MSEPATLGRPLTVEAHQGFVYAIANRYRPKHLSREDLVQEGKLGLMRGLELYDPARGTEPGSYLGDSIRATIRRAVANQRSDVRVPVHRQERARLGLTEALPAECSLDKLLTSSADPDARTLHDLLADEATPAAVAIKAGGNATFLRRRSRIRQGDYSNDCCFLEEPA